MSSKNRFWSNSFKKSLLLRCMLFVVDFVLLAGTNSVLVIWGHLGINTAFRFS